ncbi:MAG: YicC family protein [Clostridium sp. 27_14]|nr:MAG: YicC family protein [Clostridium sp. 27_14]
MIKSMTGFGKSILINEQREYQIEMKSVNHRYLDINVRIPRQLMYLEETIKKEISSKIKRGKIEVFINFQDKKQEGEKVLINKDMAKSYIHQLQEIAKETGISPEIEITEIAKMPEVLNITFNQEDEKIKQEIIELTKDATSKMEDMKKFEGIKMAEDINKRMDKINEKITKISCNSTRLIEEYIVKLEKRIKEILKTEEVDKSRLAQEVVIYADKCSIEEEITRLRSHVKQFKEMLESDTAVGKKLDFLIQEMNRETNTIASKANQLEIINEVVEIKTELENIREQIQNIE